MCLLFCSVFHLTASAQENEAKSDETIFSYSPTPQTWAFIRYGSNPVDQYTGSASVAIPVYTYEDNDFELPISVNYSSQGLIPNKQTGILGLNWFLNCGGAVSREIKGVADDHIGNDGTLGILLGAHSYNEEEALGIKRGELNSDGLGQYVIDGRETTSDVYHFNFLGHSGTFHFDGKRQLHVYNTGGNHGTYTITTIKPGNEELCGFTIHTGDGYEYTFGGNNLDIRTNSVERSISGRLTGLSVFTFNKGLSGNPIVTWNLTRIKAPNGRAVTFEYDTVQSNIGTCITSTTPNNPFLVTTFANGLSVRDDAGVDHLRNVSIVQTTYLSRISIENGGNIEFSMSLKECCDRPATPSTLTGIEQDHCITQRLKKLDAITVRNSSNDKVHRTEFTYKVEDNRLILTKVHTDGIGDYTMLYHEETPYPAISTADTDFWGFYNGKGNSYDVISSTKVDSYYDDYIDTDAKNPDWHYSRLGCLKTITYPTKGFSTFEYEANRAEKILLKRKRAGHTNTQAPEEQPETQSGNEEEQVAYLVGCYPYSILFYSNDETGGVRIARTNDCDAHSGYQSRRYTYQGGTVYTFPKFYTAVTGNLQCYNPLLEYPSNSLDKQHIGYSTVREEYNDGSYIVYSYNDYDTHPDEYTGQVHQKYSDFGNIGYQYSPAYINNILREPNSNHCKRGKTKSIEYYNKTKELVRQTNHEYAVHDTTYTAYIVMSGNYANSVKRYTGDYRLTAVSDTEYFADTPFTTVKQFTYDSRGRNTRVMTVTPDGTCENVDTEHINDDARLLYSLPLRTAIKRGKAGEPATLTAMTEYEYPASGALRIPMAVRKAQLDDNVAAETAPASLSYTTIQRVAAYDIQGNPTEIVDRNGVHTAFLWGYGGLYPIVQARGMTSATLKSLVGTGSNAPLDGALSATQRATLYSYTSALVDVYEHKPLVGVTVHYGNDGSATYYEYDAYGRLTGISDGKGRLKGYSYTPATGSLGILLPTTPELKPIE